MRKIYALCFALFAFTATAQIINFPDANFKAKLLTSSQFNITALNSSYTNIKIDTNNDGEIQQSEALNVWGLNLTNSGITNLAGLENFTNLRWLYMFQNAIANYNFPQLTNLRTLHVSGSVFQSITNPNLVIPTNIQELGLEGFNFTQEPVLTNFTQLTSLRITNSGLTSFTSTNYPPLTSLSIQNESLNTIDLSNQNLNSITFENMPNLTSINVSNSNILQFVYIWECPMLNNLNMPQTNPNLNTLELLNVAVPSVNTSGYPNLYYFKLKAYTLTTPLDFSNNLSLITFRYSGLPNMYYFNNTNLQNFPNLNEFAITDTPINGPVNFTINGQSNKIVVLDNCGITSATIQNLNPGDQNDSFGLTLRNNVNLTSFDASNVAGLTTLITNGSPISNLNVTNCQKLGTLNLNNSLLTSLDLSTTSVFWLGIYNSPNITSVNLKNGIITTSNNIFFDLCPNLQSICGDDNEIAAIQSKITQYGYTNCFTNSYCTFTTGGTAYQLNGNLRLDLNNNGCSPTDVPAGNVRVNVTRSGVTETGYTSTAGGYALAVNAGSYTITPVLEHPNYFTMSPATASVNFPTNPSPSTRDFCLTASGVRPDLEVALFPLNAAVPGFVARYLLVYKNKGNTIQSGSVSLNFPNTLATLTNATPAAASQSGGNMTWNFSNLQPFESRTVQLQFTLNTPMANPPLNGGDVLPYAMTVSGATDQTPADNTFTLNQPVVNSFDPNDKTCLQGTVVGTSVIGQYVHYLIRFENTGTFPATNVIITDVIDTNKFDINTLIPLQASHAFRTRVVQNNRVEFVFQGINLPFDDANNDGYVAFKIKTKNTLVVGDTFDNTANIFFDYNYPIITNTASTLIQNLGVTTSEQATFALAQNPVGSQLTFTGLSAPLQSVSIYNTHGQLVQSAIHPSEAGINVQGLAPGVYFVQGVNADGTSVVKMVKQ